MLYVIDFLTHVGKNIPIIIALLRLILISDHCVMVMVLVLVLNVPHKAT